MTIDHVMQEVPMMNAREGRTFADATRNHRLSVGTHDFLHGEDDKRELDVWDTLCGEESDVMADEKGKTPVVKLSVEMYHNLFKPWKGSLVLKLLDKIINYRVMEQRTRNLWKLEAGYELIDLEQGYYLARFFSKGDYYKVLEGGPWIILGH